MNRQQMSAVAGLFLVFVTIASCGGDSGGGGGPVCTESEFSVPDSPNDPCPQTGTDCASAAGKAFTVCLAGGVWQAPCQCDLNGGNGASTCGNGIREGAEQCDGADLNGANCTSLNAGNGTLYCDSVNCVYDTTMCGAQTTGGTGGGGTGG